MRLVDRLRMQRPSNTSKDTPPRTLCSSPPGPIDSAISIPEILERILSFLPQQSLRNVASLVSREWLTLCRQLYISEYEWTDAPGTKRIHVDKLISVIPERPFLMQKLENLTILKCCLTWKGVNRATILDYTANTTTDALLTTTVPMSQLQEHARAEMVRAIKDLHESGKLSLLELQITSLDDFYHFLQPMLGGLMTVTSLQLKKATIPLLPIGLVLRQCRKLQDLIVECHVLPTKPLMTMVLFSQDADDGNSRLRPLNGYYHGGIIGAFRHKDIAEDLGHGGIPKRLTLRRLHLKDTLLRESTLFAIMDSAPDLYELMIQTKVNNGPSLTCNTVTEDPLVTCDRMEFFQKLGCLYPQLTSVHFTKSHPRYSESEIRTILGAFPKATKWSLLWRDLRDGILRDLNRCVEASTSVSNNESPINLNRADVYTNHLTSLEIVPSTDWTPRWGNALHDFLCDSPLLEHLRAGSVAYYVEHLDINGLLSEGEDFGDWEDGDDGAGEKELGDDPDAYNAKVDRSSNFTTSHVLVHDVPIPTVTTKIHKIWACRNLKTLHLEFTRRKHLQHFNAFRPTYSFQTVNLSSTSMRSAVASASSTVILENSPKLSRIIYGYISRFCPRLQVLLIRSYRLNMTLKGGFLLLTRLHHLKNVTMSQYDCQFGERDILPWVMKRRSITMAQRLQWRAIVAGWWKHVYAKELGTSSYVCQDKHGAVPTVDASTVHNDEQATILDLQKLGLLTDVVDVMTEIMSTGPSQESSCGHHSPAPCADDSGHVWPQLEYMRIVHGTRVKEGRELMFRTAMKKYRPEVELHWTSWLERY
ncbi:hypothetical protein BGX28_002268 [Mortierella sp. GBA30]|nr:hypothetical protein BGX28_002268 [Mortierella sp. GBA30]